MLSGPTARVAYVVNLNIATRSEENNHMKNGMALILALAALGGATTGCGYGGVAAAGGDKVVIARNDGILFGLLRKVYVCKVSDAGVTSCQNSESP